jgi:hypothetical protein
MSPYPFWVRTNQFNENSPYVSNINQLSFPWVSSIDLKNKNNYITEWLVKTGKQSWEQKDNFTLDPQAIPEPDVKNLKQYIVVAQSVKKNAGTMIIIPSSRFAMDRFASGQSNNIDFVLNIVNTLTSGGVLSGIRQRSVSVYPLPDMSSSEQDIFKYATILVLPVLFAFYGAYRLIKRK